MKQRFQKKTRWILAFICCLGIVSTGVLAAGLPFNVWINGEPVTLEKALVKDGHTYVQLRELAEKMDVDIEWVGFHNAPVPGGNLPEGVNLNQSNILHTRDISGWFPEERAQGKVIYGVDLSSLIKKYNVKRAQNLTYYFQTGEQSGLYIREKGQVTAIPLSFYNDMGRTYVTVDEFKEKIQSHFVDICLQK